MSLKNCSKCNSSFECSSDKKQCWCNDLLIDVETLKALTKEYKDCLCANCLKEYVSNKK